MKTITLEQSKENHAGKDLNFDDKRLLIEILNAPAQGVNIAEMRKRIKLLDKIEAAEEVLSLEDAEYDEIKGIIEKFNFGIVSRHVVKLCDKFS